MDSFIIFLPICVSLTSALIYALAGAPSIMSTKSRQPSHLILGLNNLFFHVEYNIAGFIVTFFYQVEQVPL